MTKTTILLIILSLIIAGLLSSYQYLYKVKSKSTLNLFLTFLRFVSYFTVFLLLINPIISQKKLEISKTPLPIFYDNSQSIRELGASNNISKIFNALSENRKLKDKFEVHTYLFDEVIYQNKALDFKGKQSKIDQVAKDVKQLFKAPIFPIILVTDGNQTQGNDYIYSFQPNANVFPVVLGDTTEVEDLKINQVNVNKYAFLKNKFPVEVFVQYNGQRSTNAIVTIAENGNVIFKETVLLSNNHKVKTVTALLNANSIGNKKFTVNVSSSLLEKNKTNNTKFFTLEVLDQRKEIALISSIIHPDLGAIKRSIETNQQRKVTVFKPNEISDLTKFNICIFYQPTSEFSTVISQAKKLGLNAFYITGKSTDFNVMNQTQKDLIFKMANQKENYVATFKEQFNLFAQDNIGFDYFPPLENGFGTVKTNSNVTVLLGSKINQIEVENPMLCFSENESNRNVFLLGENIWKWRIESHLKTKKFTQFDTFMDKIVQFLTINSAKKALVVHHESFYNSGEPIEITAQFFNKNYEFDENAKLTINIQNKNNNTSKTYDFLKGNNEYKVNLNNLVAANYSFTVIEKNSNTKYANSFEILKFEIEKQFVNADKNRLDQLAQNTNGKAFYPSNIDDLVDTLLANDNYKAIQKEIVKKSPLIDWFWLLVLLAITLSLEWFVRKYNGLL